MKRELLLVWATCAMAASFVGCSKDEVVEDPFIEATLREATYGEIISEDYLYKIVDPEVVDALGDMLVVRQQNLTQFFTGNGIAAKMDSLTDKSHMTFRVLKNFSPIVHFQVENVVTPKDSVVIPQDKPIAFPRTQDAMTFTPPDDYTVVDMSAFRWNDTEALRAMIGKKYDIKARLHYEPADTAWVLTGYEPAAWGEVPQLRVRPHLRPSLEILMRLLVATKQDFVGGITYADIEPWDYRKNNKVCGTVDLGYVRYLDRVFTR